MEIDPTTAAAILAGAFTLAGAPIVATAIATLIEGFKRLPVIGPGIDAGKEYLASIVLSALFIVYAVAALAKPTDPVSLFGYGLAWLVYVKLAGAAYDTARGIKAVIAPSSGGENAGD